jgi:predicted kinase
VKKLLILRGLPGSGKSRFIDMLVGDLKTKVVCSADDYFMKDGKYCFDAAGLGEAHKQCREKAERAMDNYADLVVIDNTCTRRWEMEPYFGLAERYGYEVTEVTVGRVCPGVINKYHLRNNHGVPETTIEKMVNQWEP